MFTAIEVVITGGQFENNTITGCSTGGGNCGGGALGGVAGIVSVTGVQFTSNLVSASTIGTTILT